MIRAILFDWGNTVMREFPEESGPMAHWSRVEAIPDIEGTLRALHGPFRIALATNGGAAGIPLVRAALGRVGLEAYFDAVFTAAQIGVEKPDPAFFRAALEGLGLVSREAVMVGDSYPNDVAGAKGAGLRAVWFNERESPCPDLHPLYDAELRTMTQLPEILAQPFLPDVAESLDLLREHGGPPWLLSHSRAVAAVAFRIALSLRDRGEEVDPPLAHRGGLLHDLDKVASLHDGGNHGRLAGEILRGKGFPELAGIAERHVIFSLFEPASRPTTWEERLVYYADKVVEGERVVGVEERLEALRVRYPEDKESFDRVLPLVLDLEREIAETTGMEREALRRSLEETVEGRLETEGTREENEGGVNS